MALHAADVDGAIHSLWSSALVDQITGLGLDAPGLNLLGNELAAWAVERDAARIIDAVEVEL